MYRVLIWYMNDKKNNNNNNNNQSNVLGTSEQEAMQAAIIYLLTPLRSHTIRFANAPQIPICRCEVSRSSSVFVAALIRNAQIAGFGRDDADMTSDLLTGHLRRHPWCQLCFLDLRSADSAFYSIQSTRYGTAFGFERRQDCYNDF